MDLFKDWFKNSKSKESEEEMVYKESDIKLDRKTLYIGTFSNKNGFLIYFLILSFGINNAIDFPNIVFKNGGATFLCFYFLVSIFIMLPLYILEIGLGQFYGRSLLYVFKIIPIFQGLGWSMLIMNMILVTIYSNDACSCLIYLVFSIFTDMPWTYCSKMFKNINCTLTYSNTSELQNLPIYLTPSQIFYYVNVMGIRNSENGLKYTFLDGVGELRFNYFLCLIVVGILTFILSWMALKLYTTFFIFYFIFIVLLLSIITMRTVFLPGSFKATMALLYPNLKRAFNAKSLQSAVGFCMFSSCIGSGTISALASINNFKYNFYNTAKVIIVINFLFGIIVGVMQFSVIGHLHVMENKELKVTDVRMYLKLYSFIEGVSSLPEARFLIILYSLLLLNIGISSNSIMVAGFIISLTDKFLNLFQYSEMRKFLACSFYCLTICLLSLSFSLNGMILYKYALETVIEYFVLPILIFVEVLVINFLYGSNRFRSEMKMILEFSYNCFWIFSFKVLIPSFLLISIIYNIYFTYQMRVSGLVKITLCIVTFFIFLPFFVYACIEVYNNSKTCSGTGILSKGFQASEIMGPYFKENWLAGKIYQRKLINVRNNPEFLETMRETETLSDTLSRLHQKLSSQRLEQSRLKSGQID